MAKFSKCKSGNPGGRPKENQEVKELARTYTQEAIERLVFWMRQDDDSRASVASAQALLDRGHGKPSQHTELSGSVEMTGANTDNELARTVAFLLNKQMKE